MDQISQWGPMASATAFASSSSEELQLWAKCKHHRTTHEWIDGELAALRGVTAAMAAPGPVTQANPSNALQVPFPAPFAGVPVGAAPGPPVLLAQGGPGRAAQVLQSWSGTRSVIIDGLSFVVNLKALFR